MWTPVTHTPRRGPLETQIKQTLKRKRIPRVGVKIKTKLNPSSTSKTPDKNDPQSSFHQLQKFPVELQLEVWRYAATSWLQGMITREDWMYTEKNTRKTAAAHDIGIIPRNKSSLFSVSSITRSVVFETLRMYDMDAEERAHADAKWFQKGKWKNRKVWMVGVKDLKNKKSGCEIVDFGPLRRSGRNMRKRVDYKGMDEGKAEKEKVKKVGTKKLRKK